VHFPCDAVATLACRRRTPERACAHSSARSARWRQFRGCRGGRLRGI